MPIKKLYLYECEAQMGLFWSPLSLWNTKVLELSDGLQTDSPSFSFIFILRLSFSRQSEMQCLRFSVCMIMSAAVLHSVADLHWSEDWKAETEIPQQSFLILTCSLIVWHVSVLKVSSCVSVSFVHLLSRLSMHHI